MWMNGGIQTWDMYGANEQRQRYRCKHQATASSEQKQEADGKLGQSFTGKLGCRHSAKKHGKHLCIVVRPLHPSLNAGEIFPPRGNLYGGQRGRETMVGEGNQSYVQSRLVRPATLINVQAISLKQLFLQVSIRLDALGNYVYLIFEPWIPSE